MGDPGLTKAKKGRRDPDARISRERHRKTPCFSEELRAKSQGEGEFGAKDEQVQDIRIESAGIHAEIGKHDGDHMILVLEEEPVDLQSVIGIPKGEVSRKREAQWSRRDGVTLHRKISFNCWACDPFPGGLLIDDLGSAEISAEGGGQRGRPYGVGEGRLDMRTHRNLGKTGTESSSPRNEGVLPGV